MTSFPASEVFKEILWLVTHQHKMIKLIKRWLLISPPKASDVKPGPYS